MKPKGGLKCSRRFHSLRLKLLESRKRVRLGRKRFWSQRDLEALTFRESGQAVCRPPTSKLYLSSKSHLGSYLKLAACSLGRLCVVGLWDGAERGVTGTFSMGGTTALVAPFVLLPVAPAPGVVGTSARLPGMDVLAVGATALPQGFAGTVLVAVGLSFWSLLPSVVLVS